MLETAVFCTVASTGTFKIQDGSCFLLPRNKCQPTTNTLLRPFPYSICSHTGFNPSCYCTVSAVYLLTQSIPLLSLSPCSFYYLIPSIPLSICARYLFPNAIISAVCSVDLFPCSICLSTWSSRAHFLDSRTGFYRAARHDPRNWGIPQFKVRMDMKSRFKKIWRYTKAVRLYSIYG